jgi:ABC-type branched-subunit amino acid transport system substrate-binding protein
MSINRREVIRGFGAAGAAAVLAGAVRPAAAAAPLKIGVFVPDSGPAALFGPPSHAATDLGAADINAAGGILGRRVEVVYADGGASPAECAKTAIRLLLSDRVGMIFGQHDSSVREAIEGAIKGKIPYVYTPIYEGNDCTPGTLFLGETPEQQIAPTIAKLAELAGGKKFYLIGDDYVWPRTTNARAKEYIKKIGGTIVGEEYYPFGAANKFESSMTKIKNADPSIVLETLVGADNVAFNRTFADFGLADKIVRMSTLLEENTLAGIGAGATKNLYSCLGYFTILDNAKNKAFLAALDKKYNGKAPQQSTISVGLYEAFTLVKMAAEKAGSLDGKKLAAAADGLKFETPQGPLKVAHRNTIKDMYLARCDGAKFVLVDTFKAVPTGQTCT